MKPVSTKPVILVLATFGLLAAVALWDRNPPERASSQPVAVDSASPSGPVRPEPGGAPATAEARTQILYLFDASLSFHHPKPDSSLMIRAVPLLGSVVRSVRAGGTLPAPQRHMVAIIKKTSLDQDLLCDVLVQGGNIYVPADTMATVQELASCEARLQAVQGESHTDIAGALMFAALVMKASHPMPRAVIMFTDLAQDLPPGVQDAAPDLSGLCVAAVLDIPGRDASRPGLLEARVKQWADRITREWHAKGFEHWHRLAFNASELLRFIQRCDRS